MISHRYRSLAVQLCRVQDGVNQLLLSMFC